MKKDVHIHKNNENHSFKILSIPESLNPSKLSKLFKEHNIRILPLHHKPLQNIIKRGKQVSELLDRTNVVYRIECKQCMSAYIGETKRALKIRIDEH